MKGYPVTPIHAIALHTLDVALCTTCYGVIGKEVVVYLALPLLDTEQSSSLLSQTLAVPFHPEAYCSCPKEEL